MALVVIAGLLALLAMMVADQRAASDATQYRLRQFHAQTAADAGIQRAISVVAASNTNIVTLNDTWAQSNTAGSEEYDLTDGTSFRMEIVDASSLINLNMPSVAQLQSQLQLLPIDQAHIDSLLDWLQAGETARPDGAKDAFYNALPQPYNAKLGNLTSVSELLLVDNWTAQNLYQASTSMSSSGLTTPAASLGGVSTSAQPLPADTLGNSIPLAALFTVDAGAPNNQASGSARINFNTRNLNRNVLRRLGITGNLLNRVVARAPYTSFRTLLSVPGMNRTAMTNLLNSAGFGTATRTTGKLNLNTATLATLQTVPNLPQAVASAIVTQQNTGFQTLGALTTVQGITTGQIAQVADYFTIGSDTWTVRTYGKDEDTYYAEEAVVGFRGGKIRIISQEKVNTAGVPEWWNWDTQTAGTEDAGTQQ
jgi:type II secretory pathway component PulK